MKRKIAKYLVTLGALLVLVACGLLIFDLIVSNCEQQDTSFLMEQIDSVLPDATKGTFTDGQMPVMEIDGQDIIAVVEIPAYAVRLPVGSTWEPKGVDVYPRCFSGSAYDNTMIIGGSDKDTQLNCLSKVDMGDEVIIKDMTGSVFTYEVDWVERSKSADISTLTDSKYDLTLFVRETYSLQYIIVRCVAK